MTMTGVIGEQDGDVPKRGILKNAVGLGHSFQPATLEEVRENTAHNANLGASRSSERPSSNSRSGLRSSSQVENSQSNNRRRQSHGSNSGLGPTLPTTDSTNTRLKWDEVNLYLAEQGRNSKMKITEPKTPYAPQYNPDDDMDDISDLGGGELGSAAAGSLSDTGLSGVGGIDGHSVKDDGSVVGRKIGVDAELVRDRLEHQNGSMVLELDQEEVQKHREFEKHRKEHYKVPVNVKALLGHEPENIDEDES